MSQYDHMFKEEAQEQLEIAEQALLSYETNPLPAYIEEAFRALHTLKGAAHMFSLKNVGEFAHAVESVLDGIRQNVLLDGERIEGKVLNYLDHLKKLMNDPELNNKQLKTTHHQRIAEISALFERIGQHIAQQDQAGIPVAETVTLEADSESTFFLRITPAIEIQEDDPHPLFDILEEITQLGPSKQIVAFKDEDNLSRKKFRYWEIYVACRTSLDDLGALFMFIDDEVRLEIYEIASCNLFQEIGFENEIKAAEQKGIQDKLKCFSAFVNSINSQDHQEAEAKQTQKAASIRVATEKIDILMNLVSELVTSQAGLTLFAANQDDPQLENLAEDMERHIRQLRDIAFEMTLVPIETIMGRFRRLVRDCAVTVGKEIDFKVKGEGTALDKTFIDSLTDPIMHILRNSVDHGIEPLAERKKQGKPERGKIQFEAYYSGANVHLEISDDGKGLDAQAILAKAIQKGLVNPKQQLSQAEIFELIFQPGFSTASIVSDVSGRGVGMDVVKKNIESIRGEIAIASKKGEGTKITIKVPLTLSIIDGLLIQVDDTPFLIPLQAVDKCFEVAQTEFSNTFNQLLVLEGRQVPYINLRKEFLTSAENVSPQYSYAVTIHSGDRVVAIITDKIIGEYQAVLKPIGEHYHQQEFISGATILGDGTVALVLDINKLVELKTKAFAL